jgi:hypothetical protein
MMTTDKFNRDRNNRIQTARAFGVMRRAEDEASRRWVDRFAHEWWLIGLAVAANASR